MKNETTFEFHAISKLLSYIFEKIFSIVPFVKTHI